MERIPEILSHESFGKILEWLSDPEKEAPEGASDFVTTLDLLYMTRTGEPIRRRAVRSPAARLSLRSIMETSEEDEARQREERRLKAEEARRRALDAISSPEGKTFTEERFPTPRIGDGQIPFTDDNGYAEGGLESLLLARAIAWHYAQAGNAITGGRPLSMTFLQAILYITYGTALAERNVRLTDEHPQMWKYGPIFPRVYKKLSKAIPADGAAADEIRKKDPVLDEFLSRTIRSSAEKKISELTKTHTSPGSPWGRCLKRNPEKWSTSLDDNEIRDWFRKSIDNNNKHIQAQ